MMRVVSAAEVHELCPPHALMDALAEAHRNPAPLVDRSELHHDRNGTRQIYLNLPAWQPGKAMGTKIVSVIPSNTNIDAQLRSVQAVYVLLDGKTGSPLAVMDGTALTYRKTAADSGLGARFLARTEARSLLMVGAGGLAPFLVEAHRAARPSINRIRVWNRDRERGQKLAASLGAEVVDDLAEAAAESDLICCATSSTRPLIDGNWLQPGTHLDLVGSFTPDMRECDDECVRRARIFVDSRTFAIDQPGDLANPLARGIIARERIEADLFDLCTKGVTPQRRPSDITLFKNGGGAHLDLFTALFIWHALDRV